MGAWQQLLGYRAATSCICPGNRSHKLACHPSKHCGCCGVFLSVMHSEDTSLYHYLCHPKSFGTAIDSRLVSSCFFFLISYHSTIFQVKMSEIINERYGAGIPHRFYLLTAHTPFTKSLCLVVYVIGAMTFISVDLQMGKPFL